MARTRNDFAQMSSKKLNEILPTVCEEEAAIIENLLMDRKQALGKPKSIQDYKNAFAALYSQMITEIGVDKASVSVSWTTEKENGEWVKRPNVLITF